VVAFRILPEEVFSIPGKGTVNLHASLLPQYRGAAPINHAIINGEKITGLTTFFIEKQVDTGKIIFQEKVEISDRDNAGTLHDKLMNIGAKLLVKTVAAIMNNNYQAHDQAESLADAGVLKTAPKIHTENCRINWSMAVTDIYNFIRGLSPYPTAYTEITDKKGNVVSLKIFESQKVFEDHKLAFGTILTDSKTYFKIAVKSGFILIQNLQAAGRKRMNTEDFLRGFRIGEWIIKT
jgi:methionyl-tRNA formyltransferase